VEDCNGAECKSLVLQLSGGVERSRGGGAKQSPLSKPVGRSSQRNGLQQPCRSGDVRSLAESSSLVLTAAREMKRRAQARGRSEAAERSAAVAVTCQGRWPF